MEEQIYRQPRRSGKKWILIIAAVFVLLLSAVAFVLTANRLSLSVELDGEPEMMLEYGGHFQDPGAHLCVRGSLLWKDGMSPEDVSVDIQGKVDDEKTGKYILTYAADYRGMHAEAQRIVRVVDTVCPEIILAPDTGGTLLPGTPYQEAGYRAIDNYDGDITDRVVRSEEYGKIIYAVTDSSGNPGYAEREVPYYDPIPPEITLEGDADMAITTGTFYQEPGYSALDNVDGDLTQQVQVDGEVDWLTPGTYSVTYTVTDGYKNTTTVTRTVEVQAVPRPEVVWPEGKVIYLTFDDGPSEETARILAVLDQYDGHATFCVQGYKVESFASTVRRAIAQGNEIASHTWNHKKLTELSSKNVRSQLERTNQAVASVADGYQVKVLRCPYGSVGKTVRNVCADLDMIIASWELDTLDWSTRSTNKTYRAIMKGAKNGCIVVCHDLYGTTASAIEKAGPELVAKGYQLVTVSELLSFHKDGITPGTVYAYLDPDNIDTSK